MEISPTLHRIPIHNKDISLSDTVPTLETFFRRTREKRESEARVGKGTDADMSYMGIDLVKDSVEKWVPEIVG